MYRRVLITLAFVVGAIAAGSSLTSASAPTGIALAQDTETPPVQPVEHLLLGERYSSDAWEIEVQDAFVADSIDRAAYVEVRASVAFRNLGGAPVPYEWAALTGMRGFPKLQIVDQEGVIYPIDAGEAGNTLLPGSNLVSMEPYVPARWTIGFEVNGPQSSALSIEALWDGVVVAEWDVYSEPRPVEGWSAPPDAEVVDATTSRFDWTDSVGISLLDHGTLACGAVDAQAAFSRFAACFALDNGDIRDGLFPDVRHPEPTAIAIWADGSSARHVSISGSIVVGLEPDAGYAVINARSLEQIVVPADVIVSGFMDFTLPRDGRFSDPSQPPAAVLFFPPFGAPQWWEVNGNGEVQFTEPCAGVVGGPPFQAVP